MILESLLLMIADGPSARFLELPASQNIATVNVTYRTMQLEEEREVLNNQ